MSMHWRMPSCVGIGNMELGILIGLCHFNLFSFVAFSQKTLCNENISHEVQNIYLCAFNAGIGFVFMVAQNSYCISNLLYVCYSLSNGLLFYMLNALTAECLQHIPISKFIPITYMGTVHVFVLSYWILNEPVYLSDIVGSGIIIWFQLLNILVPISWDRISANIVKLNRK